MKRRWKINGILIWGTMILLGSYILLEGSSRIWKEWNLQLHQKLQAESEQLLLPNFAYFKEGEERSLSEWIIGKVMDTIPLGSYVEGKEAFEEETEDTFTYEMILANQANDENIVDSDGNLITKDEVEIEKSKRVSVDMEKLSDPEYLVNHFYTIDSTTMVRDGELDAEKFLEKDMKIDQKKKGPKVLIYHTHSQEMFADSKKGDKSTSIVGIGDYLTELLNEKYGIETLHHKTVYDLVDGKLDRSRAYQLAEKDIQKVLKENPSIEVVIDLHRDGVGAKRRLVTEVNGKPTAQIMFFNGMSRTRTNGDIAYLKNPYIQDNLAFSFQMEYEAELNHPGYTRHIYLKGYRYNMHFKPKSLLIEAGAQTNTVEEMRNSMEVLAETLHNVLVE